MGNAGSSDNGSARGKHAVKLAVTGFLTVAGITAYHTTIIIDKEEYYFDSVGITVCAPLASHFVGQQRQHPELQHIETEVADIGWSHMSGRAMKQLLTPYFAKGSYDILYKNCNHFTDCALHVLVRERLDGQYTRMERLLMAMDPVSTGIMNHVFRAIVERNTGEPCEMDIYTTNPEAQDFRTEEVIAALDEDMEDSDDSEDSDSVYPMGCTTLQPPWKQNRVRHRSDRRSPRKTSQARPPAPRVAQVARPRVPTAPRATSVPTVTARVQAQR